LMPVYNIGYRDASTPAESTGYYRHIYSCL
jgi:hypothetical protein